MMMPYDDDVPIAGDDASKTNALRVARWFMVPADEHGNPVPTRSIPIYEAEQLNVILSPVEPYYTVGMTASMLCMTKPALEHFLQKNKSDFPSVYRRTVLANGPAHIRMLSARDVRRIANALIKTKAQRKKKGGTHGNITLADHDRHGIGDGVHVEGEQTLAIK